MKTCPLCSTDPAPMTSGPDPARGHPPAGFLRHTWQGVQWLFPTTLMVLMPKCPMCVAAYIALFSGVGVTVSTAWWIQTATTVLCVTSLVYLAVKHLRGRLKARAFAASAS